MNRRTCSNCQTSWRSVADHELEAPHNCPLCGDELGPISSARLDGEKDRARAATRVEILAR